MRKPFIAKLLTWIVIAPVGIALVVFSVVNRHAVRVDFWPFEFAPEVRLFAIILGILAIGVCWGGMAAWLAGAPQRRRAREAQRRADSLQTDLRQARNQIDRLNGDLKTARDAHAIGQGAEMSETRTPALPPADAA